MIPDKIIMNVYLKELLEMLKKYINDDSILEQDSKRIRLQTIDELEKFMYKPLLLDLRCLNCGHKWNGIFPQGLDSMNVECPSCRRITAVNEDCGDIPPAQ